MNAIKKVRRFMEARPHSNEAKVLALLAASLAGEKSFPLGDLYELDLEAFELAIELMRDWRLDRYYAARLRLFDTILVEVLPELAAEAASSALVEKSASAAPANVGPDV
ncbi:MAG: hypothetical protein ACK56N_13435 [Betaproteobacteria bacterium]|jgi:hypothetical protein